MKFYKIIDPEGHNGLIYKEGINTDPLPFKPKGSCGEGGIYFSREDILAFLGYGSELYEVEPIGEVYEDPQKYPKKWKAHSVNLTYVGKVKDSIQFLIEQGANVNVCYGAPLCWAAEYGHLELAKTLVEEGADIHIGSDYPLWTAADNGDLEVVKYLVEQGANVHGCNNIALRTAAINGHLELVKYLVEHGANVYTQDGHALHLATINGHTKVAEYLKSQME